MSSPSLRDLGVPPILPSTSDRLDPYLLDPMRLPVHQGRDIGHFWLPDPQPKRLLRAELAPVQTTLAVDRDLATGQILGFHEKRLKESGTTAKNSTSLTRAPGPKDETTRGSTTNYPFWPGGFDDEDEEDEKEGQEDALQTDEQTKKFLEELEDESR